MAESDLTAKHRIHKTTLKEQISSRIKEQILTNNLQPGQPIVIDKLAQEFGVSHTPVREALAMLERDGLVELNSYQNPTVADVTVADVRDVYEMRLLIESWAIERAARNLTDEQIQHIDNLLQLARREADSNNYSPHLRADLLLHETVMRSTNNHLFWKLAERIHERSIHVRSLVEATGTILEIQQIIDEHEMIVKALYLHDPEMSRKSMIAHLEAGFKRTIAVLEAKHLVERLDESAYSS